MTTVLEAPRCSVFLVGLGSGLTVLALLFRDMHR